MTLSNISESAGEIPSYQELLKNQFNLSQKYLVYQIEREEYIAGTRIPIKPLQRHGNLVSVEFVQPEHFQEENDEKLVEGLRTQIGQSQIDFAADYPRIKIDSGEIISWNAFSGEPLLEEGDRVRFFDEAGEFMGTATVKSAGLQRAELFCSRAKLLARGKVSYMKKIPLVQDKHTQLAILEYLAHEQNIELDTPFYKLNERWPKTSPTQKAWYTQDDEDSPPKDSSPFEINPYLEAVCEAGADSWNNPIKKVFFSGNQDEYCFGNFNPDDSLAWSLQAQVPAELKDDPEQNNAFLTYLYYRNYHARHYRADKYEPVIQLIQGPTGTGKTTVGRKIAEHACKQGDRVLILSHANRGLDVLFEDIKAPKYRAGSNIGVVSPYVMPDFIRKDLEFPKRKTRADFRTEKAYGKYQNKFREEKKKYNQKLASFRQEICNGRGCVVAVTLNSLLTDQVLRALPFDTIIWDESSKGHFHEALPLLMVPDVKRIIKIGDHKQLGNIPTGPLFEKAHPGFSALDKENFRKSIFQMMWNFALGIPRTMLKTNRRSGRKITELTSDMHYNGELKVGTDFEGEVTFVDTRNRPSEEAKVGTSYIDHQEARIIARRMVKTVLAAGETELEALRAVQSSPKMLGAIAAYKPQARLIRNKLKRMLREKFRGSQSCVIEGKEQQVPIYRDLYEVLAPNIGSVDAFQGTEFDKIFVSLGRANEEGIIGHLEEWERVNVAGSRPRNELTVVGNTRTVIDNNHNSVTKAYFQKYIDKIEEVGGSYEVLGHRNRTRDKKPKVV